MFTSTTFIPMYTRYSNRNNKSCWSIVEFIDYYELSKLAYCTSFVNVDQCVEFYNTLVKIDDHTYITISWGWNIIFTPNLLKEHLDIRHSSSFFPSTSLPFDDPYFYIILILYILTSSERKWHLLWLILALPNLEYKTMFYIEFLLYAFYLITLGVIRL